MLPEIHKNGIMHGCIDYFCLVCEDLLKNDNEAEAHIAKPVHKTNLEKTCYVESCSSDHIRKVKKGYYCQFCNTLVATMAKINLHIKDEKHLFNKMDDSDGDIKRSAFLKWVKNAVIAFDDLLIDEFTWNGFIDDTCIICDAEFDDASVHKSQTEHILKLIQAKVQVGADNISRKVDDSTYQCLTCNTTIPTNEMMTHFDKPEHSKLYLECRKAKRAFLNKTDMVDKNTESAKVVKKEEDQKKEAEKKKEEEKKKAEERKKVEETKKKEEQKKEAEKKEKKKKEEERKKAEEKKEAEERKKAEEKKKEEERKKEEQNKKTEEKKKEQDKKKNAETKTEAAATSKKTPEKAKSKIKKEYEADICAILGVTNYIQINEDNEAHCLLCDLGVLRYEVPSHINTMHHQRLLTLQNERAQKMKAKYSTSDDKNTKKENKSPATNGDSKVEKTDNGEAQKDRNKIIDSLELFEKRNVRIDLISDKAFCKDCSQTIKFTFEDIEKHIADHKNKVAVPTGEKYPAFNKCDCKKTSAVKSVVKTEVISEEAEKFAEENQLTFNHSHSFAFCRQCQLKVPSSLKSMQEHVNGNGHQAKQKVPEVERPESPLYRTKPMKYFVDTCTVVEDIFRHDAVINDEICVNIHSFLFLTRNEGVIRCQVCEETVSDVGEHHKTRSHHKAMQETPVLYTIDSEFIREVRDEIYHCGFCNQIEGGWDDLQNHLKSYSHKSKRESCEYALEQHMPAIRRQRSNEQRQTAEYEFLMRLMMGAHFKQFQY